MIEVWKEKDNVWKLSGGGPCECDFFFFFDKECDLNKGERSVHSISVYTLACKVVFGPIKLPSNSTLAYINK